MRKPDCLNAGRYFVFTAVTETVSVRVYAMPTLASKLHAATCLGIILLKSFGGGVLVKDY